MTELFHATLDDMPRNVSDSSCALASAMRSRANAAGDWMDLEELAEEFTPDPWREHAELAARAGHGGGDLLEMVDFVEAIHAGVEPVIGIHEAMDITLPGLVSQRSIAEEGRWLDVPDPREW